MKFSKQWLDLFLQQPIDTDELVPLLNRSGLEVDSVQPASAAFSGVVVAYVESTEKHPDADKLTVCQVKTSDTDTHQVVCGAKNVRAGLKIAFATVGAVLGADFKIKKAKLRGVESFGMICSASELGLAEESDGILELPSDAPLGEAFDVYMNLPDDIIEVDLTPNRADCLSMIGVARDVSALTQTECAEIKRPASIEPQIDDVWPIHIEADDACLRYCGRVIKNVDPKKTTPVWMSERLRRAGINCINPVVDITNYVLLELGQPMHAFDLAKVEGGVTVRMNQGEESIHLLNDNVVKTQKPILLIADDKKPLAFAGIMGGMESSVTDDTVDILFESAHFSAAFMAGKARSYGLSTDGCHRHERGVSPAITRDAIEYATSLLIEVAGGEPGPIVDIQSQHFSDAPKTVTLHHRSVKRLLGVDVPRDTIQSYLEGLKFTAEYHDADQTWTVTVPPFRFDIAIEADLIEEVARLYGYDTIASQMPVGALQGKLPLETSTDKDIVLEHMKALGYNEIISYSFVDPKSHRAFADESSVRKLVNPISEELSEMRVSLIPGLLNAVKYNQSRQMMSAQCFEQGLVFTVDPDGLLTQSNRIAGVLAGELASDDWSQPTRKVDFFDAKGDVEHLLALTHQHYEFVRSDNPILHPGQAADINNLAGDTVGFVGALHPLVAKSFGLKGQVVIFELDQGLFNLGKVPQYRAISKFPYIRRDLALIVDDSIEVTKMTRTIAEASAEHYFNCAVFDLYQGPGVPEGKKSIAFGVNLQSIDKTFTDVEINEIMERILHALKSEYGAELRE